VIEYSIANNATPENLGFEAPPEWWTNRGYFTQSRGQVVNNMVEDVYSNIFQDTYSSLTRQTVESIDLFKSALSKKPTIATSFGTSRLSQDLRMMAEIISVQKHLGNNRQIFFTTFGGWDHHDEVLLNQGRMLPILSDAMGEFYAAMEELQIENDVVTFTISDFARTLTSNGNGSDHAWGGNQMIMGGAIDGGNIFGNYPNIALNDALNIDERGRFVPTTILSRESADWYVLIIL